MACRDRNERNCSLESMGSIIRDETVLLSISDSLSSSELGREGDKVLVVEGGDASVEASTFLEEKASFVGALKMRHPVCNVVGNLPGTTSD
jgi:hypothetical protein